MMRRVTKRRRKGRPSLTAPVLLRWRDIVRIAPCRATWRCDCQHLNTLFFDHVIKVGFVLGRRIKCSACPKEFRGRYITGLAAMPIETDDQEEKGSAALE